MLPILAGEGRISFVCGYGPKKIGLGPVYGPTLMPMWWASLIGFSGLCGKLDLKKTKTEDDDLSASVMLLKEWSKERSGMWRAEEETSLHERQSENENKR